ncbi:BadF/BadG/BcrA/BcrD ATPase family protein [Streptomyces sp. NPDC001508]|uniref:N-acetylglucosamine kinase n=1 Tax=Streptomyces sp. NPDC001508 TaxID=3154656 RepID=UPI00332CB14D
MAASDALVLGIDVGGTASRALVATLAGERAGYAEGPGANPNTQMPPVAAHSVGSTVRAALSGVDAASVRAAVMGIAGAGRLTDPHVAKSFRQAWREAGLTCPVQVTGDVVVAFAAGTPEPDGAVLIAGTGAIAARIEDRKPVRSADGLGWLLGDEGSGFWLGRQAMRAAVRELCAARPPGPLSRLVAAAVLATGPAAPATDPPYSYDVTDPEETARRLVLSAYDRSAPELARLAPLVSQAAEAGDPLARDIARTAALRLVATVGEIRTPADRTPIVLAGSVLTSPGPVRTAVQEALAERWPGPVLFSAPGAAGAAWLAARSAGKFGEQRAVALHRRLSTVPAAGTRRPA